MNEYPIPFVGPLPQEAAWRRSWRWLMRQIARLLRNIKQHWMLYPPVFAIWGLAFARVFVDPTPHLPLLFNWTPSVPYRVALVHYGPAQPLDRGNFIIYAFNGGAQRLYPGLRHQPFFKQIAGLPGDSVTVTGREVFVNGKSVGIAKPYTFDRHPLDVIQAVEIPPGYYYVQGTHPDSFDSRYRASGLVRADQVLGKVTPLF